MTIADTCGLIVSYGSRDIDKIQWRIGNVIYPDLTSRLLSLYHRRKLASLWRLLSICILTVLMSFPLSYRDFYKFKCVSRLTTRFHSFEIGRYNDKFYANRFFFSHLIPIKPFNLDHQTFKCKVNRHLLSASLNTVISP